MRSMIPIVHGLWVRPTHGRSSLDEWVPIPNGGKNKVLGRLDSTIHPPWMIRDGADTYPVQIPISVVICSRLLHPPCKEHCVDPHCSPSHRFEVVNRCSVEIGIHA